MTELIIHVGLPKTGTTTLRSMFQRHPQIQYLGKSGRFGQRGGMRSKGVERALRTAIWSRRSRFDANSCRELLQPQIDEAKMEGRVLLCSLESISEQLDGARFEIMLQRLTAVFGRCRVLYTLRNPITWTASMYFHQIRGHYLLRDRRHMGLDICPGVDEWMRRMDSPLRGPGLFAYGPQLQACVNVIGRENVGLLLVEDMSEDLTAYARDLSAFLGIASDETIRGLSVKPRNARMSHGQFAMIRELQSSPWERLCWLFGSARKRRLRFDAARSDKPARLELTDAQIARIHSCTVDMNRWVSKEFNVDLQRHRYPT